MAAREHEPLFNPPLADHHAPASATAASARRSNSSWEPYRSADEFIGSMALVFIILLFTVALAVSVTAAVRFFLRRRGRRVDHSSPSPAAAELEKREHAGVLQVAPLLAFTAGMELAGAEAECAICLAEFAEGEGVRVMPACNHGFHARCIGIWLASNASCPTCRCSYRLTAAGPPEKQRSPSESERV